MWFLDELTWFVVYVVAVCFFSWLWGWSRRRGIPHGPYCYDAHGICRYWDLVLVDCEGETYRAGMCHFTGEIDSLLLLDQCKTCGVRNDDSGLIQIDCPKIHQALDEV